MESAFQVFEIKEKPEARRDMSPREIAEFCGYLGLEKKAFNVLMVDLRERSSVADYFLVMSGTSQPHVQTIAENIQKQLRKAGHKPVREEGISEGRWALIDTGDVIVHVFQDHMREFYDLEGLWKDAPKVRFADAAS